MQSSNRQQEPSTLSRGQAAAMLNVSGEWIEFAVEEGIVAEPIEAKRVRAMILRRADVERRADVIELMEAAGVAPATIDSLLAAGMI